MSARGLQEQSQPWPDPDTERLAAEYQPEQEIVIVVEREHGGASTYRMAAPVAARGLSPTRAHLARAVYPLSDHMTQVVTTAPATPPVKMDLAVAAWLDEHRARALTHGADDAEIRRFRAVGYHSFWGW